MRITPVTCPPRGIGLHSPLALKPPALFDGYIGDAQKEHSAVTSPKSQGDLEGSPKPTVHLSEAVPPVPDEILRRRRHAPTPKQLPGNCVPSAPIAKPSQCLSTPRRTPR